MDDLKQLRALRAVAETGSFSAAADRLEYTQPAISKMIAALERSAGTRLVDRGSRPLALTDAGEVLARGAGAALAQLTLARRELEEVARGERGRLSVATFSSAGATLVVDALCAVRAEHPGLDVAVAERSMPSQALAAVRACEVDLAVSFDYPGASVAGGAGLELRPLLDDPMDVVVGRSHRLAGRRRVGFADLAGERWVLPDFGPDSPSFRLIAAGCAQAGYTPEVAFRINDCQMAQALVAAGEGIALQPRLMLRPPHPGVRVKPLRDAAPIRRIVALRLEARHRSASAERFLAHLRRAAQPYAAPI